MEEEAAVAEITVEDVFMSITEEEEAKLNIQEEEEEEELFLELLSDGLEAAAGGAGVKKKKTDHKKDEVVPAEEEENKGAADVCKVEEKGEEIRQGLVAANHKAQQLLEEEEEAEHPLSGSKHNLKKPISSDDISKKVPAQHVDHLAHLPSFLEEGEEIVEVFGLETRVQKEEVVDQQQSSLVCSSPQEKTTISDVKDNNVAMQAVDVVRLLEEEGKEIITEVVGADAEPLGGEQELIAGCSHLQDGIISDVKEYVHVPDVGKLANAPIVEEGIEIMEGLVQVTQVLEAKQQKSSAACRLQEVTIEVEVKDNLLAQEPAENLAADAHSLVAGEGDRITQNLGETTDLLEAQQQMGLANSPQEIILEVKDDVPGQLVESLADAPFLEEGEEIVFVEDSGGQETQVLEGGENLIEDCSLQETMLDVMDDVLGQATTTESLADAPFLEEGEEIIEDVMVQDTHVLEPEQQHFSADCGPLETITEVRDVGVLMQPVDDLVNMPFVVQECEEIPKGPSQEMTQVLEAEKQRTFGYGSDQQKDADESSSVQPDVKVWEGLRCSFNQQEGEDYCGSPAKKWGNMEFTHLDKEQISPVSMVEGKSQNLETVVRTSGLIGQAKDLQVSSEVELGAEKKLSDLGNPSIAQGTLIVKMESISTNNMSQAAGKSLVSVDQLARNLAGASQKQESYEDISERTTKKRKVFDQKPNVMSMQVKVKEEKRQDTEPVPPNPFGETRATPSSQQDTTKGLPKKRQKQQESIAMVKQGVTSKKGKGTGGKGTRTLRQQVRVSSYDETMADALIEEQLGTSLSKSQVHKKKLGNSEKEYNIEATIAASIGFPREALTEEEIEAGVVQTVGSIEQENYIMVRNHILAKWRENVNIYLKQDMVMESIRMQHKNLVSTAYKFLVRHGYINFGVAPAIKAARPVESNKGSVIIIGAGLAGLGAARQLLAFGHKVTVIEGRQRPGGRVYTKRMEGDNLIAAADLGGSVVTGVQGNPLGVLARQLGLPLHKIREKCPIHQPNGMLVKEDVDAKVELQFNKLLDSASKWREDMEQVADSISLGATLETLRGIEGVGGKLAERQLYDWHLANLEYANAGLLTKLSLAFWDQDDPYEMGGDHCFLPGGNVQLISALAADLPIFYGKTAHTIKYGSEGVKVLVGNEVFEADMALCTVPLGVLQRGMVKFEPDLSQRKQDAIKRLGFGLLNKVVMLFPKVFWDSELDIFGHLAENPSKRGEFFLFYSYATVSGGPLLLALVAGEAAIEFEQTPPLQAVTRVMNVLKGIYEPRGISVPNPVQTVCTRWGSDYLCYGSYSNVAVGASGDDYDILAESVGDGRLFFAGEATIRRYPATMHGAYMSGLREAGNIAAAAAARLAALKGERGIVPKDMVAYSATLAELFKEPDLEFGSFSIIFDHQSNDPQSIALVKLQYGETTKKMVGESSLKPDQQLYMYTTVTRQQAYDLREVRGDKARFAYLCHKLGVKLVGRRGLGPQGDALVVAIKWNRATRKSGGATGPSFKSPKPGVTSLAAASK